jgi:hypothetical protein
LNCRCNASVHGANYDPIFLPCQRRREHDNKVPCLAVPSEAFYRKRLP